MGKLVKLAISNIAAKKTKKVQDHWMKEVMKRSLMESPIRMLALFSNETLSLYQAEGVVDLLNLKIFKGIKKIRNKIIILIVYYYLKFFTFIFIIKSKYSFRINIKYF